MLKTLFTNWPSPRYGWVVMLFLAAAIVSAAPSHGPPPGVPHGPPPWAHSAGASVQARATIRIISGAELRLGKVRSADPFLVRDTVIQSAAGEAERVRVFEFQ